MPSGLAAYLKYSPEVSCPGSVPCALRDPGQISGNIRQSAVRYKGEVRPSRDPAFKQFESMPWGYRAIFVLLDTYRIRHGLETIRGMISRWAPPSENHTEIYIRAVADAVGIADDRPVDTRDRTTMLRMAAAISRVENGTAADMDDVERGWELFRQ